MRRRYTSRRFVKHESDFGQRTSVQEEAAKIYQDSKNNRKFRNSYKTNRKSRNRKSRNSYKINRKSKNSYKIHRKSSNSFKIKKTQKINQIPEGSADQPSKPNDQNRDKITIIEKNDSLISKNFAHKFFLIRIQGSPLETKLQTKLEFNTNN